MLVRTVVVAAVAAVGGSAAASSAERSGSQKSYQRDSEAGGCCIQSSCVWRNVLDSSGLQQRDTCVGMIDRSAILCAGGKAQVAANPEVDAADIESGVKSSNVHVQNLLCRSGVTAPSASAAYMS